MSDVWFNQEFSKLVQGIHLSPNVLLGCHKNFDEYLVRIWRPGFLFTSVKVHGELFPLSTRKDALGIFEFNLPNNELSPFSLYEVALPDGRWIADPYNFSSNFSDFDAYLFCRGVHYEIFNKLGAHLLFIDGIWGVQFAVWAPGADGVSVVGDFCLWNSKNFPMILHCSGVWTLFIPGIDEGEKYKFAIFSEGDCKLKSDPFGFHFEKRPKTASIVNNSWKNYDWTDEDWLAKRRAWNPMEAPISIYEVHLGSWRRTEKNNFLSYEELASSLGSYVKCMGFTHVELLPITEHPLDESWGYQTTGYFAPTSRFGNIQGFQCFVDTLHNMNIGVIIDWVPAHFSPDDHGLREFDGHHLYESADPLLKNHPHWGTLQFDYGKNEVSNFLIANALFWISELHVDGFRVDAVSSMLYRDYGRQNSSWSPNQYGGKENLEAIEFLKHMNAVIRDRQPGVIVIAEESTSWAKITGPVNESLGFHFKWNMGWMHDTLHYFQLNPFFRSDNKKDINFCLFYSHKENFLLPFSHDEVVHCKKSLFAKMADHTDFQFAHVRLFFAYQLCIPGKKLIFMGSEWGTSKEWCATQELHWKEMINKNHFGVQKLVSEICRIYKESSALWEWDNLQIGFQWIDIDEKHEGTFAFLRKSSQQTLLCIYNFASVMRSDYTIQFFDYSDLRLLLNSESSLYEGNFDIFLDNVQHNNGRLTITLPPCAVLIFEVIFGQKPSRRA